MTQAPTLDRYFSELYGASEDPYQLRTRWYEQRKRAILLGSLPCTRYANAYEPACGAAELSVALATRCDRLLISDFCEGAVQAARRRTAALPQVRVEQHCLPQDWPHRHGPFDLIILSELGYFLESSCWGDVAQACLASLSDEGDLVACDWRPDFAERRQGTDAVHGVLGALGLHALARHEESDFLLQVWSRNPRSVAQREGIRGADGVG